MSQYSVAYGKREEVFSIPQSCNVNVIQAKPIQPIVDFKAAVLQALANPIQSQPFSQLFKKGEKVVIIVSDITRLSVRSHEFLPILLNELNKLGIPDGDVSIIMSTGDHRGQTVDEYRLIVGEETLNRVDIYDHDCHAEDLASLGTSSRGTRVFMNRQTVEADRIILTGGISYHMIAGFGGGRKSICPGVCGYQTIQDNHGLSIKAQPGEVGTGILETNPVSLDMEEVTEMVSPDFLLNVIVDEHKQFIGVVAGNWRQAHVEGTKLVEEAFGIPISTKAEVVIASSGGYPKDIQLYQSIKALDNAAYAADAGGHIILVSECFDGPGPDSFLSWFQYKTYEEMSQALYANFTMPGFVALRTAEILKNNTVYLVSGLDQSIVENVGMRPVQSVDEALELIMCNNNVSSVHIMPYGSMTFPILNNRN